MLRHNFDFMHIGKNMSESFVNTFLGTVSKSKDNLNSRLDIQALGIRTDLHPVEVEEQLYLSPAPYTMRLEDVFSRTPDMPKIKIMLNEYGQPVGENSRRLAGAIGIQARRTLPLGCDDWRLVDAKKDVGSMGKYKGSSNIWL